MNAGNGATSPIQIVFGVVFMLVGLGVVGNGSFYGLVMLVIGGILLWHGYEWGKLRRVKRAYDEIRNKEGSVNLGRLAKRLDMEPNETRDALEELRRRGLVPKMSFVAAGSSKASKAKSHQSDSASRSMPQSSQNVSDLDWFEEVRSAQPKRTAIRCPSCGAMASLFPGEEIECEHCGNTLTL